jgi:pyruvate ferredoxin oxidoreductase gamma subunit
MGTVTVRWLGRGGQGGFTAARLLGVAATMDGLHALAFPAFGPERRGAPVSGFTKVSDQPVRDRSEIRIPDYLVVLDSTLLGPLVWNLWTPATRLIVNAPEDLDLEIPAGRDVHRLDASALAEEYLGRPMVNTAMLGGLVAISAMVSRDAVRLALLQEIKPEVRCENVRLFDAAFQRFSHDFVI